MPSESVTEFSEGLRDEKLVVLIPTDPNEAWIAKIKSRYPGLNVSWVHSRKKGEPDPREHRTPGLWEDATLLLCDGRSVPEAFLTNVRYCQLTSAGTDKWANHATYKDSSVIFCNASGIHPPQIAEWVMGTWLAIQHHLFDFKDRMKDGIWDTQPKIVQDSMGLRMGILGYGSIGRQCARLGQAMGMEVYAYTRSPRITAESRKDTGHCIPGTGDPDGTIPARWFHGASSESVDHFLDQDLDMLVISLPLTDDTRNLLSYKQFSILSKKKTFVSNIARGPHIDSAALITALETGQIRAAALDVTDPEPLPKDHPLWKTKNLFISPHISWMTTTYYERCLEILEINLGNLASKKPCLNAIHR